MLNDLQTNFAGGMNLLADGANLGETEYLMSFNLTNRFGSLIPLKQCSSIALPESAIGYPIQALDSLGNFFILFARGLAWYAPITTATNTPVWTQILGFIFTEAAAKYWTCSVPRSSLNALRKLISGTDSTKGVAFSPTTTTEGTPRGMVVQDGVNQPMLIYEENGVLKARPTKTYAEWTTTYREYVPIGKQMTWFGGKLLIASPDGTLIYQSVSWRPLDFMVIVSPNGGKLDESDGSADIMAYSVSFDPVTGFYPLNSSELLIGTDRASYSIQYDFNTTVFGEPLIAKKYICDSGPINERSIVDILGDIAFINYDGVRSFNAVSNNVQEGKNSVFSLKVSDLFDGIVQTPGSCCCGFVDNYGIFACESTLGQQIMLIYDMMSQSWSCIYNPVSLTGTVYQFASIAGTTKRLFCATTTGLFEIFAGASYEIGHLLTRDFVSKNPKTESKPIMVRAKFANATEDGNIWSSAIVDGFRSDVVSDTLEYQPTGIQYPIYYPVTFTDGINVADKSMAFTDAASGWKNRFIIRWDNGAELLQIFIEGQEQVMHQSLKEQAYAS